MKSFSQQGLDLARNEIKNRHKNGYKIVINKIISQIKEFHDKNNPAGKILIGISGGIDSTVVATLAKKAVSSKNLILVYLPALKNDEGMKYYPIVKKFLGAEETYIIPINVPTNEIIKIVKKTINHELDAITKGNIAARIRVNLFYAIAKEKKALVLGTSNRTEFLQGYATKYGTPISCDFGVLDELYKTDIIEIASILKLPKEILTRTPSTGFFVGQTHEDELNASMNEQDAATYLLFEKKMKIEEVHKKYGASKSYLLTFIDKYNDSLHKRRLQSDHVKLGYIK